MLISGKTNKQGQALVEFALILGVLLLVIFVMIESAHLLQANLTVQNAARAGGRYAITGQFDDSCLTDTIPCEDPRVASIKAEAEEKLAGLQLDPDALFEEPGFYLIEVFGTDEKGEWVSDSAGVPGRPILVRVSYRAAVWTPLLQPIAETVMVSGQTVMNNEKILQANTAGDTSAPGVPNPPPVEPTPQPPPDLVLTKSAPPSVVEGSSITYKLTIKNTGQRDATGVVLTDTLPSEVTYDSASTGCGLDGASTVVCTIGTVPVGGDVTVNVVVTATTVGTAENNAKVNLAQNDGNDDDNEAKAVTEIKTATTDTDLAISKTGSTELQPVTINPGDPETVNYQITVTNLGPNDATGVEVTDTLPAGMLFIAGGSSPECTSPDEVNVTCGFGDLDVGQARTRTIQAMTPQSEGVVENTASISAANPGNDVGESDSHEIEFALLADLEVEKVAEVTGAVYAGESFNYHITVRNHPDSPHQATAVNIYDALPQNVELISAESTQSDGNPGSCVFAGSAVTCDVGNLAQGATATADITVRALRAEALINTAQVSSDEEDPDPTDNVHSILTQVEGEADLAIEKTAAPEDPYAGDLITYTLTITNGGPALATGVRVEDPLPDEVVFQYVTTTNGSCEWLDELSRVVCYLGTMAVDEVATVEIAVVPLPVPQPEDENEPPVSVTNTAYVTGDGTDPQNNNDSSAATTVLPGDPFILVQPVCGRELTINGYLWGNDVLLEWEDAGGSATEIESIKKNQLTADGEFTVTYTIPDTVYKADLEIVASQEAQGTNVPAITDRRPFSVPCPNPDLEILDLSPGPGTVMQYESFSYTVTVTNTGNEDATGLFYVGLYAVDASLPLTTTHLTASNRIGVTAVSQLAMGDSITVPVVIYDGLATVGTYYIYALADSEHSVEEMYETNNLSPAAALDVTEATGTTPPPGPPPAGTVNLTGRTHIKTGTSYVAQPQVRVTVSDMTGTWQVTVYSDSSGDFAFTDLPDELLLVTAVFSRDGVVYRGLLENVDPPAHKHIYLDPES